MTPLPLTESQLWYLRKAMEMGEDEGGYLWRDPPEGVDPDEDLQKLYELLGGIDKLRRWT